MRTKDCGVIFTDIKNVYSYSEDLVCKFRLNDYSLQEGDRVAMYKSGWSSVKDYILFEWAPIDIPNIANAESEVVFSSQDLPKDESDRYQLCYISGENDLQGASIIISFCKNPVIQTAEPTPIKKFQLRSIFEIQQERRLKSKSKPVKLEDKFKHHTCESKIRELETENEILKKIILNRENEINSLKSIVAVKEEQCKMLKDKNIIELY